MYPTGTFDAYAGLLVNRGGGTSGGFGYTGGQIGNTWNNNSANTHNFRSGLAPPLNQWSFVTLVLSPTNAIVYMANASGQASATNILAHNSDVLGNNWQIASDNNDGNDSGARTFSGMIDEVVVDSLVYRRHDLHRNARLLLSNVLDRPAAEGADLLGSHIRPPVRNQPDIAQ